MKDRVQNFDKDFLMKRMGSLAQLGGVRRYEFAEGRAKGMGAVEVVTGTGLDYMLLPDRCLDIAWVRYKGAPVSYLSKSEIAGPTYVEPDGLEWLRDFHGGMMTTCGFANLGGPGVEEHPLYGERPLCVHGRLAHIPANEVCAKGEWIDGKYVMTTSGTMYHSAYGGENLTLRRKITSVLGERKITISDVTENEGHSREPFMLLYHTNFGYPLLDKNTRIIVNEQAVRGADELSQGEIDLRGSFQEPEHDYPQRNYYYKLKDRGDGKATVAIINDEMEFGVAITANIDELPCLTEWKFMAEGEYILALEPCNTHPMGRAKAEERGEVRYIEPGEKRYTEVTLEIIDGAEEIKNIEKLIMG